MELLRVCVTCCFRQLRTRKGSCNCISSCHYLWPAVGGSLREPRLSLTPPFNGFNGRCCPGSGWVRGKAKRSGSGLRLKWCSFCVAPWSQNFLSLKDQYVSAAFFCICLIRQTHLLCPLWGPQRGTFPFIWRIQTHSIKLVLGLWLSKELLQACDVDPCRILGVCPSTQVVNSIPRCSEHNFVTCTTGCRQDCPCFLAQHVLLGNGSTAKVLWARALSAC